MVFEHQKIGLPQVGLQARLFLVFERNALVIMVGQGGQDKRALLADGQDAMLLSAHADPGAGVRVKHAAGIGACLMHGAVNDKASRVDGVGVVANFVALHVDFDQAGGGDLIKHQAIRVDQKLVRAAAHAGGQFGADVGEDQVRPSVQSAQAVTGSEGDTQLPFIGVHLVFQAGGCGVHVALSKGVVGDKPRAYR